MLFTWALMPAGCVMLHLPTQPRPKTNEKDSGRDRGKGGGRWLGMAAKEAKAIADSCALNRIIQVSQCIFSNQIMSKGKTGGAVYICMKTHCQGSRCIFSNQIMSKAKRGGAVYICMKTHCQGSRCIFSNQIMSKAKRRGSCVHMHENELSRCIFSNQIMSKAKRGGAVYICM